MNLVLFICEYTLRECSCSVDETCQHVVLKYVMKIHENMKHKIKKKCDGSRNFKNMLSESDKTCEEHEEWCICHFRILKNLILYFALKKIKPIKHH